jgi:HEPN domain-containing protein
MSGPEVWLRFALDDLTAAERLLRSGGPWNMICFHAQQGAEKLLKGFLLSRQRSVPRLHSLVKLLALCSAYDAKLEDLRRGCEELDGYYIPARYPDAAAGALPDGMPTREHARRALGILRRVLRRVRAGLAGAR